ncbi:CGNR zinc finger domain-containing protein [Nocardioides yefusunii]|uniref:CGNR zinc finger domain-containing protein n=1 Tax=Nocardioides yefusunii TaxID=2500546 RepID=A0ABW1QZ25_9ACTN|nr:ABATE domain-containing protein [Nocardioides yefusunii]
MDATKVFRLENDVLAFRFTATLSDRAGESPRERLVDPAHLELWFRVAGLDVVGLDAADLRSAVDFREVVHRVGSAFATGLTPAVTDLAALNRVAAGGRATLVLDEKGCAAWSLENSSLADALSVIAQDAIRVLGACDTVPVRLCEGPGCAGLFVDGSRGRNRRWCSMNTCGNRIKKARLAAK